MPNLIDLNQTVFVPVVDESKGGVEYEIKMTLAEFFKKCLPDFEPEIVDAIPTEWLSKKRDTETLVLFSNIYERGDKDVVHSIHKVLELWRKELDNT